MPLQGEPAPCLTWGNPETINAFSGKIKWEKAIVKMRKKSFAG
jgi:hypothetical protein